MNFGPERMGVLEFQLGAFNSSNPVLFSWTHGKNVVWDGSQSYRMLQYFLFSTGDMQVTITFKRHFFGEFHAKFILETTESSWFNSLAVNSHHGLPTPWNLNGTEGVHLAPSFSPRRLNHSSFMVHNELIRLWFACSSLAWIRSYQIMHSLYLKGVLFRPWRLNVD